MSSSDVRYAVVVPTVGRSSLVDLLTELAAQVDERLDEVLVVDDRRVPEPPLTLPSALTDRVRTRVLPGFGRGPAAARNLGWQVAVSPWVAFLDDDVRLSPTWAHDLAVDLSATGEDVAGCQARIRVPLPTDRAATDWERNTAGLEHARWATADMAFRRPALVAVHGFDERFPRAYREDADLALRLRLAGWRLVRGGRETLHPVRPAGPGISVRLQRGNADDALMHRLHGRRWRRLAATGTGRFGWHVATTAAGVCALGAAVRAGARDGRAGPVGAVAGAAWLALTADFTARRLRPGPRTTHEVATMAWTSVAIPPAAVWHRVLGWWRHRNAHPWPPPARAILFDRDGTLVADVPFNDDPALVEPMPTAGDAVALARRRGLRTGVVTNQSGMGRGLLSRHGVARVNGAVDRLLGPFDTWQVCPHSPADGCGCRKPAAGLVHAAARALRVPARDCVVVGDIGADVAAARAAGARAVLVPTPRTRPEEVADAPLVADDLLTAVHLAVGSRRG